MAMRIICGKKNLISAQREITLRKSFNQFFVNYWLNTGMDASGHLLRLFLSMWAALWHIDLFKLFLTNTLLSDIERKFGSPVINGTEP
jgi:hypothetical protein